VRHTREARPNAVGLLYYAGHGASDSGINYLIPVDVKSAEEGDVPPAEAEAAYYAALEEPAALAA
jgi:uncharacterized caspase-like protein